MIEWINEQLSIATIIWLFPITFLLHDFMEIIFIESWFQKNYYRIKALFPKGMENMFHHLSKMNAARFSVPVFMQFILYILASYLAVEKAIFGPFIAFNIFLFLHIFGHIGQSILLKTNALGLGSGLMITFPYSIYMFYRLLSEEVITYINMLTSLPYGLIVLGVFWLGHVIAPKIIPDR